MPFKNQLITGAQIVGGDLQSANYVPGVSGWKLSYSDGSFEASSVFINAHGGIYGYRDNDPSHIWIISDAGIATLAGVYVHAVDPGDDPGRVDADVVAATDIQAFNVLSYDNGSVPPEGEFSLSAGTAPGINSNLTIEDIDVRNNVNTGSIFIGNPSISTVSVYSLDEYVARASNLAIPIPSGYSDLDTYTSEGTFAQRTNADASSGDNYPTPYAGLLEVFTSPAAFIWQRYTPYRNYYNGFWVRAYYGSWSEWLFFGGEGTTKKSKLVTASGSNLTPTTTPQTLISTTIAPDVPGATYLATMTIDIQATNPTNTFTGNLEVNGTTMSQQAIFKANNLTIRQTITQQYLLDNLSAGSNTLKVQVSTTSNQGSVWTVRPAHSNLSIVRLT